MNKTHNPDVLSCLANLSNDEVFTPPSVVNQMLDMLPQELFRSGKTTFLDIGCKSGVFLREITKRLITGLADEIPDLQTRVDHILHKQVFGIATTELTSLVSRRTLYCSKYPNCRYSASPFETVEGNIRFRNIPHTFVNGRCKWCGASEDQFGDAKRKGLETHAYEFIHTDHPEEIFKMKFDVIVGNPPYQLDDGGNGVSAKPIYHLFVQQAKKLSPRYLVMIIPARWYAGGKGLDAFRSEMLHDQRVSKLVDYENSADVFNGVDIAGGICYFLWDRSHKGKCTVTNTYGGVPVSSERALDEFETFIRHKQAVDIVHKVLAAHGKQGRYLSEIVSSRKPFGLPTNYEPRRSGVPCWFIQRIGLSCASRSDVYDESKLLDKWKLLVPPAPIAGQTDFSKPIGLYYESNVRIARPGECCTESYIVAGAFNTQKEVESFKTYLFTKTFRFLLLQTVVSQHVTKKNFCFVPDLQQYDERFTDEDLRARWGITAKEWQFIDSRIA